MSELHEIDGIIFGGEKYTVGEAGAIPEGLFAPSEITWSASMSSGSLRNITPVLPDSIYDYTIKLPDIDGGGNYITKFYSSNPLNSSKKELWKRVILPSHLEAVPNRLFDGGLFDSGQLEFVEFGDHLTSIGDDAFRNNQLTSVVLPDSVISIGSDAFRNNQITSVVLPDSLITLKGYAFENNQITSVVIPDSVTSIGNYAFRNNQLTSVVFPESLTSIGTSAFEKNQLTSVVIPDSVISIGNYAFNNSTLEEVSVSIGTTYEKYSFYSKAVVTVRVPEGYAFGEGLTSIANNAYQDKGLTGEITIADSVTSIGFGAFYSNQITSVIIPDSVTSIEDYAFRINQITSVVIPDSVTSIGTMTFGDNPLKEVSIGPNTTYVNTGNPHANSFPSSAVITVRD